MQRTAERAAFRLEVRPSFWVLSAFLGLAAEEGRMLFLFFLACLTHELGHFVAAICLRLPVDGLTVSAVGLELSIRRNCSYLGEFLLTAAGPAASILLTAALCGLSGEGSSLLAGISLILGLFNLLPVQPLDGGELLRILLCQFLPPERADQATLGVGSVVCALVIAFGLVLVWKGNPSLLIMGFWLTAGLVKNARY